MAGAAAQAPQNNPHYARPENEPPGMREGGFDDGDDDGQPSMSAPPDSSPYGTREPQPYIPRDAQPFPQHQQRQPHHQPRQPQGNATPDGDVDRLPSFITAGQQHKSCQ